MEFRKTVRSATTDHHRIASNTSQHFSAPSQIPANCARIKNVDFGLHRKLKFVNNKMQFQLEPKKFAGRSIRPGRELQLSLSLRVEFSLPPNSISSSTSAYRSCEKHTVSFCDSRSAPRQVVAKFDWVQKRVRICKNAKFRAGLNC